MSISPKFIAILATALFSVSAMAQYTKKEEPNYIIFRIGSQSFDDDAAYFSNAMSSRFGVTGITEITSIDSADTSVQITEGFHINNWVVLEGSATYTGETEVTATLVNNGTETTNTYTAEYYGLDMAGMFTWHFKPWLFAYAKAGAAAWRMEARVTDAGGAKVSDTNNKDGVSFLYGAGVQATFGHSLTVAAAWEQTEMDDLDVSRFTVGAGFAF